jgi:hypothetical protein
MLMSWLFKIKSQSCLFLCFKNNFLKIKILFFLIHIIFLYFQIVLMYVVKNNFKKILF